MLHASLRRRAKLVRGLLLLATIGLPLALVLYAIQASAGNGLAASSSSHVLSQRDRAVVPWLAGHRGADPAADAFDIQPANMDGDVVYACWVDSPSGPSHAAPLHLTVSHDGAYSWQQLTSPLPRAAACHLVPDASDARRITLVAQIGAPTTAGCPTSRVFISVNGGVRWSAVSLPSAMAGACALSLSSVGGTLALWTKRAAVPINGTEGARLWLSLDAGNTWRPAGDGLPSGSLESVVSARTDGALLVLLRRTPVDISTASETRAATELWSCTTGCLRWHEVASVPGSAPTVFAVSGGWRPSTMGWGTLYTADTAPASSGTVQALAVPGDGAVSAGAEAEAGAWHLLPSPLWSAVESGRLPQLAAPGQSRIVGVGPDGSLVLESQNAAVTIGSSAATHAQAAASVLNLWDPGSRRWLMPMLLEPDASTALAAVWDEQGANGVLRLTIWLGARAGDVWPMVVPNSGWQVSQPVVRCQRCG